GAGVPPLRAERALEPGRAIRVNLQQPLLNELLDFLSQNTALVGGAVLLLMIALALLRLVRSDGYAPNKRPRNAKQAKAWAAAAMAKNDYRSAGEFFLIAGEYD